MKFFLNPGHCPDVVNGRMLDSGAVNVQLGLKEAEIVRDIAKHLQFFLESAGHTVVYLQSNNLRNGWDDDMSYPCITTEANKSGADFAISIHLNACDQQANGTECFVFMRGSSADRMAQHIQKQICHQLYRIDRGVKYEEDKPRDRRFSFIMKTDMPAIIVECCFIDSWVDADSLIETDGLISYAKAIFDGINDYMKEC